MKKTANGIERGYGNWWNSFYKLIASTATANSDLIEEPSAPTSEGTSNDLSDMGIEAVKMQKVGMCQGHPPIKEKFQLDLIPQRSINQSILYTLNKIIESDNTAKIIKMIEDENERAVTTNWQ